VPGEVALGKHRPATALVVEISPHTSLGDATSGIPSTWRRAVRTSALTRCDYLRLSGIHKARTYIGGEQANKSLCRFFNEARTGAVVIKHQRQQTRLSYET
jgi:hypothetical protein